MTVSQARLNAYRSQVNAYSEAAGTFVSEYISALLAQNPSMSVAEVRNEAIEAIKDSLSAFGDQAASIALDFLEDIVASYGISVSTSIVDAIDDSMIDGGVRYAARKLVNGDVAGFTGDVADLSRFYTKRSAFENMVANCESNNIRYARVPSGFETCEFCIMLASRGFVYHTAQTAGEGHAYHKSCDCVVVPGVEGIPASEQVEGYDPEALYRQWRYGEPSQTPAFSHSVESINLPSGRSGVSGGMAKCDVYKTRDGKRFVFPENMDTSKQDMSPERAMRLYGRVPDNVKRHMQSTVFFVDYKNPQDSYWRSKYKRFTRSYATGGDEITFYAYTGHNDDYVVRTFCHEAGHYIDASNQVAGLAYSSGPDWQNAMTLDYRNGRKSHPTQYAANSYSEDFAESVAEYSVNEVQFRQDFPNRAALLDSLLI